MEHLDADDDDVRVVDEDDESRYAIWVGEEVAGFTDYVRQADAISLTHTEIRSEFEHQGLASRLIAFVLDSAAEDGLSVLPYCPFVRRYIADHSEYLRLVPEADRLRFDLA